MAVSLLTARCSYMSLTLTCVLFLFVFDNLTFTSALVTQKEYTVSSDDPSLRQVNIDPFLKVKVGRTPRFIQQDAEKAFLTAANEFATQRLDIIFRKRYPHPQDTYIFEEVSFNLLNVERFTVNNSRRLRVFEKEEADVERESRDAIHANGKTEQMTALRHNGVARDKNSNNHRAAQLQTYGTAFLLNGDIKFSTLAAPADEAHAILVEEMQRFWGLYTKIMDQGHPDFANVRYIDLSLEVLTPEPTMSPAPSTSQPTPSPSFSSSPTQAPPKEEEKDSENSNNDLNPGDSTATGDFNLNEDPKDDPDKPRVGIGDDNEGGSSSARVVWPVVGSVGGVALVAFAVMGAKRRGDDRGKPAKFDDLEVLFPVPLTPTDDESIMILEDIAVDGEDIGIEVLTEDSF